MSIRELKAKKIAAIRQSLEECPGSQFSEGLKAAFRIDGERQKSKVKDNKIF